MPGIGPRPGKNLVELRTTITAVEMLALRRYAAGRNLTVAQVVREKLRQVRYDSEGEPIWDLAVELEVAREGRLKT